MQAADLRLPPAGTSVVGVPTALGRLALSASVVRRSRDGPRFKRRSRDGYCNAGLGPPTGGPRPSGDPSRMKSSGDPSAAIARSSPGLAGLNGLAPRSARLGSQAGPT
eukprot:363391-Chlamydomonas_euryale.AAC.5